MSLMDIIDELVEKAQANDEPEIHVKENDLPEHHYAVTGHFHGTMGELCEEIEKQTGNVGTGDGEEFDDPELADDFER